MALLINSRPYEFSQIGNEIFFIASDDVANHVRFEYFITANEVSGDIDTETFEAYRNQDDLIEVTGLEYLLATFFKDTEYPIPRYNPTEAPILAWYALRQICKKYTLTVKSISNSTETKTETNLFALMGGIPAEKFDIQDTFYQEDFEALIRQKDNKIISPTQPEWIYFLQTAETDIGNFLRIDVELTLENLTTISHTYTDNTNIAYEKGNCFAINASYLRVVGTLTTSKVIAYKVRVRLPASNPEYTSRWISYQIDHEPQNQEHIFAFVNSAGGMTFARFTGELKETLEVEQTTSSRFRNFNSPLKNSPNFVSSIEGGKKFEVSTGYSEDWEIIWQDLMLSRQVYIYKELDFYPVKLTSKKITTKDDDLLNTPNMTFDFEYLYPTNFVL